MPNYDVGIIGAGIAGTFAALRIAERYNASTILFDIGRPPGKRRRQIEGFLGCFPTGDGKIYPGDLEKVKDIVDGRKATPAYKWVHSYFSEVNPMKIVRTPKVSVVARKRIRKAKFELQYRNYYQWKPESVHKLSRMVSDVMEESGVITYNFDNEVFTIRKNKGTFVISTANGPILCKKIILCVGRSGWRWVTNLYDDLGIISSDDHARYGVRVEVAAQHLKDFKGSHCELIKDNLEIGPLCWNGTVIPEDHSDLVISAFRSNEDRWRTDKVSFSLLSKRFFKDEGSVQADRIGKLSFLLFNDRVSREKIKTFMSGGSLLNLLPEFDWLKETMTELGDIVPKICDRGYFHVPNISPMSAQIRLGTNLESEVDGMFVAGESAGVKGIAAAAIMGTIAGDSACK
ncbi:hypothetical protein LCGC14_0427260 [marine sediment metagenome]|uniref:FAD dependent oxidoreductase domain-containing protein n=1 Tax=marine sediment metagenome TaxID=412755 RepID=A0A0F9SVI0_9ZZZZ